MMKLHIAKDLSLPVDVVTQTIAVLAKRRAGKSYLMRRLVEQLFNAAQQVVLVDPKGDQWGIRSAADGKGPGLSVVILGGERADVPLEAGSGEIVAKLVVEERVSALLDLSLFRKHEVATFMTGFLENLYRLKAREIYRTPLMLVMDEADAIAPQKPQKGEERMLGAAEDIVRRGGQRGIGCVLVTQRSAVLNKNLLTQAQVMIALRTIAPQDLAAMNAWIDVHGTVEQRQTLMESLPSLPVGDAWIWSPGWPTIEGIFKRVHVLPIETFDSGATPKPGEKRSEPKTVADVDLDALKRQMASTIEKAKANDPSELRRQVADLKRQLGKPIAPTAAPAKAQGPRREDVATITALRKALEEAMKVIVKINAKEFFKAGGEALDQSEIEKAIKGAAQSVKKMVERHLDKRNAELDSLRREAQRVIGRLKGMIEADVQVNVDVRHNEPFTVSPAAPARPRVGNGKGEEMAKVERLFLTALAQQGRPITRNQVAIFAGYSAKSRHVDNTLAALRSNEYVVGGRDAIEITDAGLRALGAYDPLPTGGHLQTYWIRELDKAAAAFLSVVCEVYPGTITRDDLATRAGYSPQSRHVDNTLAQLRSRDLVSGDRDAIKASENLFG
jgi:alkylated DNA nucleotide flippase Atl1